MTDPLARRLFRHPIPWLLLAIGAVFYCRHYWDDAPGVTLYVEAARCMLQGLPLQSCNPFYTYPPIFAFVSIPLVPLPLVAQNFIWYALTSGGLMGCCVLSVRLVQQLAPGPWSLTDLVWLYVIGVILSLKFVFAAVASQSYDTVVVLLILAGLVRLAEERDRSPVLTGVYFAAAAALKATPLLFLPYLLLTRHYRAAAVMAVALVVLSVLPDLVFTLGRKSGEASYLWGWLQQVAQPALSENLQGAPHTFWLASNTNNNSLRGLVGMFVTDKEPGFKSTLYIVYAIYCAVVGLLILRTGNDASAPTIDGALLLISMLMLSPMSSESHYVALVLPIFAAAAIWRTSGGTLRRVAGYFLIAEFLLINAAARDIVGMTLTTWAKDHRLLVIATLLHLGLFAAAAFRPELARAKAGIAAAVRQSAAC
jgi:Glycosyltransferase family 87